MLAQASLPSVIIAVQDVNGIHFYSVDTVASMTRIGGLPQEFKVREPDESQDWFILYEQYLAPSPDQTLMAFTAQQGDEGALFLYSIPQNQIVKQIAIPLCLKPVWSPDGSGILLTIYCGQQHTRGGIDYVYDLGSGQLHALDSTEDDVAQFQWLTDSSGFLYEDGADLSIIARDGEASHPTRQLTNLRSELPEGAYVSICDPVWSAANQRYYYIVGCIGGGEIPYEYIYSVDLEGNNRNETFLPLPYLYPKERTIYVYGLHADPAGNDMYITLGSQDGSEYPDGLIRWRIVGLSNPGEISPVYEEHLEESIDFSLMSPDGNLIALFSPSTGPRSEGLLKVVSLDTGEVVATVNIAPYAICDDAQWLDNTHLLYTVDSDGYCTLRVSSQRIQTWQLDVMSGSTRELAEGLNGTSWILPSS